jgi:hypothetical protein
MPHNPLSPPAVLASMADAIPTHAPDDTTSDVSASYEVVALFVHACMKNSGFVLLGFDEDKHEGAHAAKLAPRLDAKWNATFGAATFVYQNNTTNQVHALRVDRVGQLVEVRATTEGSDRVLRFSRPVRNVVSSSGLPIRISLKEDHSEDRSQLVDSLRRAFVSEDVMIDLAAALKTEIIQHLGEPGGTGKLNEDDRDAVENAQRELREQPLPPVLASRQDRHDKPAAQPDAAAPPDPFGAAPSRRSPPSGDFSPPGFEDPYDINRMPGGVGGVPGRNPFAIGSDDLYPAGLEPSAGLHPFLGPGSGLGPGQSGGGMHPTFDDPLFGGHQGQGGRNPAHPPGARWDPLGPPGPRFGGPGGGPGGYSSGPFGGGDII